MPAFHFRPTLQPLERRDTPAFTSGLIGTSAQLIGDGSADTFRVSASGGLLSHNRFDAGDPGFASSFDWNTAVAGVQNLAALGTSNLAFLDMGDGDDTLLLGTGPAPARTINAVVSLFTGGGGADRVFIDNFGSAAPAVYDCTSVGVQSLGVNLTALNELERGIVLFCGSGPDVVNVLSSRANAALLIDGNDGSNQVNVGDAGIVAGVAGTVRVAANFGGPVAETTGLILNDSADATGRAVTISDAGADTVIAGLSPGAVVYTAGGGDFLDVALGGGGDSVAFSSARPSLLTTVTGGGGDDALAVSAPVTPGGVVSVTYAVPGAGTAVVAAGAGTAAFSQFERLGVAGTPAELVLNLPATANAGLVLGAGPSLGISQLSGPTITPTTFSNPTTSLTVNLGAAGDSITMNAMDELFAPTGGGLTTGGTLLRGGAGADSFTVTADADSPIRVSGGDPAAAPGDTLSVATVFANPGAVAPAGTIGTGPGFLAFDGIETLNLSYSDSGFAAGTDAGVAAEVRAFDSAGVQTSRVSAFDGGSSGGARVAGADFTGDGVPELVLGTGPGAATLVRILDGATGAELFRVAPFEASFTGGVFVAAGDLTGDGKADLIITPDQGGGPRVRVFTGAGFGVIADFFGIDDPAFRGGARAAVGDINRDGIGDLIVSAGFGGGPRVAGFDGATLTTTRARVFSDFFVFEDTLRNGVYLASGDVNGDGLADLVAGAGPGGGPRVLILSGSDLKAGTTSGPALANFFAGDPANRGGVRVAVRHLDADARGDLVAGSGAGAGTRVTAYLGSALSPTAAPAEFKSLDAFTGTNGVFVG